jgi:membrane protease YdiL (CAAX protease family)
VVRKVLWVLAIGSLIVAIGPIAIAMTVPGLGPLGYLAIATIPVGLIGVVLIPILLIWALADRLRR